MRLLAATLLAMLVGATVILAAPRPQDRPYTPQQHERRAFAARICRAQGANCRVLSRPGAPRDLTGIGCICH